jgi:hypothetical protein
MRWTIFLRLLPILLHKKISKLKNLILKKLGYTSTEQLEPQYIVGGKPYYDGAPNTCALEAPAALVLMALAPA